MHTRAETECFFNSLLSDLVVITFFYFVFFFILLTFLLRFFTCEPRHTKNV